MKSASALHPGLPHVPPPVHDELLGGWLLRIAQLYGLGLAALVARLAPRHTADATLPHWFALHGANVDVASLASALRVSPKVLFAMAPPSCLRHWPCELGLCTRCLELASLAGEPLTWYRRWMHPLATVCPGHGVWLTPVATCTLRRIRHAGDFGRFFARPDEAPESLQEMPADLVEDALWLQKRCQQRRTIRAPWGSASPVQFSGIAATLAHLMMSADVRLELSTPRRFGCDGEPVKIFAIEGSGRRSHWTLPARLRHRQLLLGEVGELMRRGPKAMASLPDSSVKQLENGWTTSWPAAALQWICPQAADVMRREHELQPAFGVLQRYVRA